MRSMLTPIFRAWWRATRGMTLGVRVLAADGEGHILLVRHTYVKGWHLPGGGVEHGQTVFEAASRELAEEAGVAAVEPIRLVNIYSNAASFPNDHVALMRAGAIRSLDARPDPREIAEYGFFPRDALPDGVTEGTRLRLAEVFGGAPLSHYWTPPR